MTERCPARRWPVRPRRASALVVGLVLAASAVTGCAGSDGGSADPRLPTDAQIAVLFGLRRDDAGLARAARVSSDPASRSYGRFLTVAQVARRYGASAQDRRLVLDRLHRAGARAHLTADGGAVVATMTPEQVHAVLGRWPVLQRQADGSTVATVEQQLKVPGSLRGAVTEVAGARSTIRPGQAPAVPGTPAAPSCADTAVDGVGQRSPLGAWYGFDDYLYRDDIRGQGRRVAILAIGGWRKASLQALADCYGTRPSGRVTVVRAPGVPAPPVGPEVALDVAVASSFAPEAQIDVIQYDRHGSVAAGLLEVVDRSAHGQPYDAVSTSIGYCESDLERGEVAIAERALLALAATGSTTLASSGDTGSAGCAPSKRAAVQYPASSPWAAGVGGTALRAGAGGAITAEQVWSASTSGVPLAGGGGTSTRFARPWYQRGLNPPGARSKGRMVPDVAFLADPSVVPPIPICESVGDCRWYRLGGTSAPAPALAAALALVDQDLTSRRAGADRRLGLLTPMVRHLALAGNEGVYDVTQGSNRVLGLPCCDADPGYDVASGWGSVRLPALADAAAARHHR